jgi:hypothetical protein
MDNVTTIRKGDILVSYIILYILDNIKDLCIIRCSVTRERAPKSRFQSEYFTEVCIAAHQLSSSLTLTWA